jgi:hypothetical protein
MVAIRTEAMAKAKGRPKKGDSSQLARFTVINLKGSEDQVEWLESVHRKTHLPKAVIIRLALSQWGEKNGMPAFPSDEAPQH